MADEVIETTAPAADAVQPVETAPKPVERDKVQERIGELTYRLKQAEAALAKQAEPKPVEKPELVKPTLEQSGHDEDAHQAALEKYREDLIERRVEEGVSRALAEREAKAAAKSRGETFASRMSKLTAEQKQAAESAYVGHNDVAELIMESEVGPEILLYLSENPEIGQNIANLSISQRAKEIGRIEATLEKKPEAKADGAKPELKPVVSKAPPPAAKIEATEAPVIDKDPKDMSDAEFAKWRRRQIAHRS